MTELERRALLGDARAQEECTRRGIVLPCPFCGNEKNIISNWGMFRCWCPNCLAKAEDALTRHDALKAWNTRHAPPINLPAAITTLRTIAACADTCTPDTAAELLRVADMLEGKEER